MNATSSDQYMPLGLPPAAMFTKRARSSGVENLVHSITTISLNGSYLTAVSSMLETPVSPHFIEWKLLLRFTAAP